MIEATFAFIYMWVIAPAAFVLLSGLLYLVVTKTDYK